MRENKKLLLLLCLYLWLAPELWAQISRSELEKEKTENLKRLEEAQKILSETRQQRRTSLGQFRALQRQIKSQEALIETYRLELATLKNEMNETQSMMGSLESDLNALKKEYTEMVYRATKANRNYNALTFLLSAQTFNQLLMRIKYLEQYSKARQDQVAEIQKVKNNLDQQVAVLEEKRLEQTALLETQVAENNELLSNRKVKNTLIKQLSSKESVLKSELAQRKKAAKKLDNLIADIIRKEMEASKKASGEFALTPEAAELSSSFQGNKNKLNWPVSRGFISSGFGVQPHPVLKGVKIENAGVDIQTGENEIVRAVFKGEVSKIASIPGMNGVVVILQHGEYRTVYANLKRATVKVGDQIEAKGAIGEVYTDKSGVSEVQFQVWKNFDKLDPQAWLFPR